MIDFDKLRLDRTQVFNGDMPKTSEFQCTVTQKAKGVYEVEFDSPNFQLMLSEISIKQFRYYVHDKLVWWSCVHSIMEEESVDEDTAIDIASEDYEDDEGYARLVSELDEYISDEDFRKFADSILKEIRQHLCIMGLIHE